MIINSSKGKLISNNISRAQAIKEGLGTRLNSTSENTKKQMERQSSNTSVDHDTKKVIRNTERVATPLATIAMTSHLKHQIEFQQNVADWYVKKHKMDDDLTNRFNEMGMAAKSFNSQNVNLKDSNVGSEQNPIQNTVTNLDNQTNQNSKTTPTEYNKATKDSGLSFQNDTFGNGTPEVKHVSNAGNQPSSVNAETVRRMEYQNISRIPSTKTPPATLHTDETMVGDIKHVNGTDKPSLVNYGIKQNISKTTNVNTVGIDSHFATNRPFVNKMVLGDAYKNNMRLPSTSAVTVPENVNIRKINGMQLKVTDKPEHIMHLTKQDLIKCMTINQYSKTLFNPDGTGFNNLKVKHVKSSERAGRINYLAKQNIVKTMQKKTSFASPKAVSANGYVNGVRIPVLKSILSKKDELEFKASNFDVTNRHIEVKRINFGANMAYRKGSAHGRRIPSIKNTLSLLRTNINNVIGDGQIKNANFSPNLDVLGIMREEFNANMDEKFAVSAETIKRMKYEDGMRIPSAKNTTATFKMNQDGSGTIEVKHNRGVGEMKHINYEAFRTAAHNTFVLRHKLKNDLKGIETLTDCERKNAIKNLNKNIRNVKEHGTLAFLGSRQNKLARRLDAAPRKISRQLLRLGSAPLENSESMRGIHLIESCRMTAQTAAKCTVHVAGGVVGNMVISGRRIATFVQGMRRGQDLGVAFHSARQIKHKMYGTMKGNVKGAIRENMNKVMINVYKNTGRGEFFARRAEIMNKYAGVKKSAKTELKVLYREWLDKGLEKAMPKTYAKGKKISNAADKLFNPVKLTLKQVRESLGSAIKRPFIGRLFSSLRQAMQVISAILAPIFAVASVALVVLFIIMILCCFWDGNAAAQKQNQAFIVSQSDGKAIMNSLEDQHAKLIDKVNQIASKYDTSDIQYPSGSNENYKELFCAIQVQMEYDLSLTNNKFSLNGDPTLADLAESLYDQTHIISEEPYEFEYDDGTKGTACHIHVDIQRGETLAYSIFEGRIPSDVYLDSTSTVVPTGTGDVSNWMDVCLTVKTLIAQTQSQYNQSGWIWIDVNGQKYHVRTDCSGYVSACLQVYGATTGVYGTAALISDQHFPGFTYMRWPGWNNLQQGDILVRRYTGTDSSGNSYTAGHTEIFYGNVGGQHLVFSNGSTAGIQSIYPRNDNVAAYDIIYRPTSAGQIEDTDDAAIEEVTGEDQKYIFRNWSRSFGENALLLASNMDAVTINPETGNEDGYDTAIKATVASGEFAPSSYSGTGVGDSGTGADGDIHFVAKGKKFREASSLDYIRYICAQHGVCADYSFDNMITNTYNTVDAPYSPVVDDSIKRTNSGISSTDSTESLSDLPMLKSPYAFDNGMDDLGNLQIGDIMFYVWDLGSWTSNYDNTDYNTWAVGSEKFYTALDHSIPMMYIGDGNFTYYGRTGSGAGAVRTINVSEMQQNRCLNKKIIRYVGFTVSPVFGSTPSFCGWTDNKIGELIVLQHGTQWTEGKIHLSAYGLTEAEEKELEEMSDEDEMNEWNEVDESIGRGGFSMSPFDSKDIDYSFYHEAIFQGDEYKPSESHVSTLMDEICSISIKYYDMYGILPSIAYSQMGVVSNFRSTEESLIYYNLFEVYDDSGVGINKYKYTDEGEASTTIKNYKRYSSYLAAYQDWTQYAKTNGYSIDTDFAESFAEQRDAYTSHALIGSNVASEMTGIYNSAPVLAEYDQAAIDRKEAIDNLIDATKAVNESTFSAEHPAKNDYEDYCKMVSDLASYISELDDILSDYDSATPRTNEVLDNAIKAWKAADEKATAAYKYYEDHKEDEYIESWVCLGHINNQGKPHNCSPTMDAYKTCTNRGNVTFEEWEEHGGYDWNEPSYTNKYVEQ